MLKTLLNRLRIAVQLALFATGMFLPVAAEADIDSAFQSLLSNTTATSSKAGVYRSEVRTTLTGGSLDIRFPSTTSPPLISVTPVNIHAGCGGISATFGGLSFISGAEIKQLVQNIESNSVGVAIDIALEVLCPQCAHVLQVMRELSRAAAATSINSCQAARALMDTGVNDLFTATGFQPDKATASCATQQADSGASQDWYNSAMNGMTDACNGVQSAASWIQTNVSSKLQAMGVNPSSANAQASFCALGASCNSLWTLLNQTMLVDNTDGTVTNLSDSASQDNYISKLLLMNILGTVINCGSDSTCSNNLLNSGLGGTATTSGTTASSAAPASQDQKPITVPPTLGVVQTGGGGDMKAVVQLYMCGVHWSTAAATMTNGSYIQSYCQDSATGVPAALAGTPVWVCMDSAAGGDAQSRCLGVTKVALSASPLATSEGFLPLVMQELNEGVAAVQSNSPMPQDVISLLENVPLPLYQVINAAAVYPDVGQQMLGGIAVMAAQLMTLENIRTVIQKAQKVGIANQFSETAMKQFYSFTSNIKEYTDKESDKIAKDWQMQQTLSQQIREINVALQKDVFDEGLLGQARFSTAVVTPTQVSSP